MIQNAVWKHSFVYSTFSSLDLTRRPNYQLGIMPKKCKIKRLTFQKCSGDYQRHCVKLRQVINNVPETDIVHCSKL